MTAKLTKAQLDSFKPFDAALKGVTEEFLRGSDYTGSDFSYHAFLSWFEDGEYLVTPEVLYLRCRMDGEEYYWQPLPREGASVTRAKAALALPDDAMFAFCTEDFVNEMYGGYYIYTHRDWAEYIYDARDFIELPGKRFHAKRNHIAKFTRLYDYDISGIKADDREEIARFEAEWMAAKNFDGSARDSAEREREIVGGWLDAAVRGELRCDILRVGGKMVGIAIGEITPTGTGIEMYEKADASYEGVYSFLAHEFAARNFSSCRYINRQEDMGMEGLRKSKLSYNPAFLLQKYVLKPSSSVADCYAARTGRLLSKPVVRHSMPADKYDIVRLSDADFDRVWNFLVTEREGLRNKLFFLNYTEEELHGVLEGGGMFAAVRDGEIISTCAYDTDEEYGAKLAEICGGEGRWYELGGIMTAARYRGLGISDRLTARVIEEARKMLSPATLCAVVQFDNAPSLGNLEKHGFVLRATRPAGEYTFSYLTLKI